MIIKIHSSGGAGLTPETEATGPVPRVGEWIELQQDAGQRQGQAMMLVTSVRYVLRGGVLTPVVACHPREDSADNRLGLLEEQGWIRPA